MRKRRTFTLVIPLLLTLLSPLTFPETTFAATDVSNCVYAGDGGLQNALTIGGEITFSCSGTIIVPNINITTTVLLDGNGQDVVLSGNNTNRIFDVRTGGNLTLKNITLTNGKATYDGRTHRIGGAINTNWRSTLHIIDSVISNSEAQIGGGIHSSPDAPITIENTIISENTAWGGAGLWNGAEGGSPTHDSILTIRNSSFFNNHVILEDEGDIGGGALNNRLGHAVIENTIFSGNTVTGNVVSPYVIYGGAIANTGTMAISGSVISNNSVVNDPPASGLGGGIFNRGNSLTITNSLIYGNIASGGGGGIGIMKYARLVIENSTISGNSALTGAGIESGIAGNFGGSSPGKLSEITNSTIVYNTASSTGGISHTNASGATLSVVNSIVASNSNGNCNGDIINAGFNLSTDGSCPPDFTVNTPAQINLGPLANNGGVTQTYALLEGSEAIDSGNCQDTNDQRGSGFLRPLDFPMLVNEGNGCDIGAYEVQNVPVLSLQDASPMRNYFMTRHVTLTWNKNDLAIGYEIEVAANVEFSGTLSYEATMSQNVISTVTNPLPNGLYYWHLRPIFSATQTVEWSSTESFLVDAP